MSIDFVGYFRDEGTKTSAYVVVTNRPHAWTKGA
jgi:hypothetical protein